MSSVNGLALVLIGFVVASAAADASAGRTIRATWAASFTAIGGLTSVVALGVGLGLFMR